jgi:hypothetical protein
MILDDVIHLVLKHARLSLNLNMDTSPIISQALVLIKSVHQRHLLFSPQTPLEKPA